MNDRTFLDIDDTILTKNLTLLENASQVDNLVKQSDSKPSIIIQPVPGICVKLKTDGGEKTFINICTSDKIQAPKDMSSTKILGIMEEENPSHTIPISIGSERLESDRGGFLCATHDVVINTTYFEKCQKDKLLLLCTIITVIRSVADKFNKTLNTEDFKILKNRKVMGKLQQCRIENREPRIHLQPKKPLIEEIKSSKDVYAKENEINQSANISSESVVSSKLNYVLLKQPSEGAATLLIGLFQMPKGITGTDVDVLLDKDRIVITADNSLAYDLSVPYTINVAQVKCLLDKDLRVLRLDMPVQNALDNV